MWGMCWDMDSILLASGIGLGTDLMGLEAYLASLKIVQILALRYGDDGSEVLSVSHRTCLCYAIVLCPESGLSPPSLDQERTRLYAEELGSMVPPPRSCGPS